MSTCVVFFANLRLYSLKLIQISIAKSFKLLVREVGCKSLNNILTRVATIVVWRTLQFVLNLRVEQYELVSLRIEWEVFEFAATAVKAHKFPLLTKYTCELIHDTTVDTDVVVLCSLTCECHVPL